MWTECPSFHLDWTGQHWDVANVTPEAEQRSKELLAAMSQQIPKTVLRAAQLIALRVGRQLSSEAKFLAKSFNVDWRSLLIAGLAYDLILATFACSTIALATPSGPVLARNMDFWPERLLARASAVLNYTRDGAAQFVQAGWPGSIGVVSGMSLRGRFAIVVNAVVGIERTLWIGFPVLLHMRRVIEEAANYDDAIKQLSDCHLMTSVLFTVVGSENSQRVVIERSPKRSVLRHPEGNGPLFTTNSYRSLNGAAEVVTDIFSGTACSRYDALCDFLGDHRGERNVDDAELLYRLTDPRVIQAITAQHIIFRPAQGTTRLFAPNRFLED